MRVKNTAQVSTGSSIIKDGNSNCLYEPPANVGCFHEGQLKVLTSASWPNSCNSPLFSAFSLMVLFRCRLFLGISLYSMPRGSILLVVAVCVLLCDWLLVVIVSVPCCDWCRGPGHQVFALTGLGKAITSLMLGVSHRMESSLSKPRMGHNSLSVLKCMCSPLTYQASVRSTKWWPYAFNHSMPVAVVVHQGAVPRQPCHLACWQSLLLNKQSENESSPQCVRG